MSEEVTEKAQRAVEEQPAANTQQSKRTPRDFLKSVIGKPVVVKLNSGVDYRGFYVLQLDSKQCFVLTFN